MDDQLHGCRVGCQSIAAHWLQANKTAMFRKEKMLVSCTLAREKGATKKGTLQVARLVESRPK